MSALGSVFSAQVALVVTPQIREQGLIMQALEPLVRCSPQLLAYICLFQNFFSLVQQFDFSDDVHLHPRISPGRCVQEAQSSVTYKRSGSHGRGFHVLQIRRRRIR